MTQPTLVGTRPPQPAAIARINPRDTYNFLPVLETSASVLDVGSGSPARWVVVGSAQRLTVVEPFLADEDIQAGKQLGVRCVRESGEAMHSVPSSAYDMVISRVSLPYMRPHRAVDEFARVLVPGGRLFLTLHDAPSIWRHLLSSAKEGHWKDVIKRCYTLVNGAWISVGGRAFAYPFSPKRAGVVSERSVHHGTATRRGVHRDRDGQASEEAGCPLHCVVRDGAEGLGINAPRWLPGVPRRILGPIELAYDAFVSGALDAFMTVTIAIGGSKSRRTNSAMRPSRSSC